MGREHCCLVNLVVRQCEVFAQFEVLHEPISSTNFARSLAIFWVGTSQDSWDPSEYHNWRLLYCDKRIIHQRQMDTADSTSQHHVAHNIYLKQFVIPFCGCQSFIFQHEQTCWSIFRCICKRETKASSLHRNDCEEVERPVCRYGLPRSTSNRLQSSRRLQA